jgi:hypothetical protein
MKYKLLSLLILSFLFASGFAQNTVTISINGVKKGEYTINTDQANSDVVVKKSDCKKMKQLLVQVNGEFTGLSVYKRSLDIADKNNKVLLNIPEKSAGQFFITDPKIKTLIQKGVSIKLFLLMEPANERLMISSKHIYMGTLIAK